MSEVDTFNVMQSGDFRLLRWIEIEGLPYCYGTGPGDVGGSFFTPRAVTAQRFEGIRCWLEAPPPIEDVEINTLDAFPKNAGALQAKIVDVDGSVTRLVNTDPGQAFLSADYSSSATTIVYTGIDPGFGGSSGIAYIGNETISYATHNAGTKTLGGIVRGRYRSVARAWGLGIPISLKPYTMAKRRVWYFTVASNSPASGSFFGFLDANRWLRFAGTLESLRANDQLTGYEIKATSIEKDLDRAVFSTLRQFEGPPTSKIRGIGGTEGIDIGGTWSSPSASAKLRANELVAARMGDEIITIQRIASSEFLRLVRRGLMNTPIEEHPAAQTMREVVLVCPGDSGDHTTTTSSTTAEKEVSFFSSQGDGGTSGTGGGTWFPEDHPLAVFLGVMLSGHDFNTNNTDGNGFQPPNSRAFDLGVYIPKEWCLGIDATRLDLAAICRLGNETAWLRTNGVVEESINFIEWSKSLLQPFGFYVTYTAAGLLTVRPLRPPLPSADLRTLTNDNRIRTARPGYDSNLSAIVSSVEYRYGWDVTESRFRRIVSLQVNEGALYSGGRGRNLAYESKLLYTGRERIPGELSRTVGFDVNELLAQRGDFYQARFARPPAILIETVKLDLIDVALGDLISVTSDNSPSPSGGGRGLNQAIGELIGKRVDEIEKTIEMTILLTGFQTGDYRCIGPAAIVSTAHGAPDNVFDFFTDPPGTFLAGRDGWADYTAGTSPIEGRIAGNTIAFFPVGSKVRHYPNVGTAGEPRWSFASFNVYEVGISTPAAPSIELISNFPSCAVGDLICLDTYANEVSVQAGQRASPPGPPGAIFVDYLFAFASDNAGLFSNSDPGHRFFPA